MKPLLCVVVGSNGNNWTSIFIVVGVVCALLVALLIAALYLLRIKQNKGGWVPWFLPRVYPWAVLPRQGEASALGYT